MKNKKGFTLIELLAVVIILGILMTVGGIAVTRITENTRKSTFINTAQEYAEAVRTLWTSDSIYCGNSDFISSDVKDGDYYVLLDSSDETYNYLLEQGGKSSWGNKNLKGYVRVNITTNANGKRDVKYYVSITDGIHAIEDTKEVENLKKGDIKMDISKDQNTLDKIQKSPFEIGNLTTCGEPGTNHNQINEEKTIEMLSGKIEDPKIGNIFRIKNDQFYIISATSTTVTAIAKYNLYVGGIYSEEEGFKPYGPEATGLQNSNMLGYNHQGVTPYSKNSNNYNGSLAQKYVIDYKNKLESYGMTINEARLITKQELETIFNCPDKKQCNNSYPWIYNISYWTQTALSDIYVYKLYYNEYTKLGNLNSGTYYADGYYGVRPVITVNKSEFK